MGHADDHVWQCRWLRLAEMPIRMMCPPRHACCHESLLRYEILTHTVFRAECGRAINFSGSIACPTNIPTNPSSHLQNTGGSIFWTTNTIADDTGLLTHHQKAPLLTCPNFAASSQKKEFDVCKRPWHRGARNIPICDTRALMHVMMLERIGMAEYRGALTSLGQ